MLRLTPCSTSLAHRAMGTVDEAQEAGDVRTALAAISQAKGVLELQAKMRGELDRPHERRAPTFSYIDPSEL